jgi:hypothetical protein
MVALAAVGARIEGDLELVDPDLSRSTSTDLLLVSEAADSIGPCLVYRL